MVDEKDQKDKIFTEVKELHQSMELSQDKEYELKSRLATTEACLHDLETKMKDASSFHENLLASMKNEWDSKISSLQAALVEEQAQKANDLTELETLRVSYEGLITSSKSLQ